MERKSAWKRYNEEQLNDLEQFATDYKEFITECKTERECVSRAVSMAKKGDTVLLLGKGSETYQEVRGVRSHFSDVEEAEKALEELKKCRN